MKKFLTFVCIVATMLGSTATFTSCSTDIDGNSTTNNIRRVFPDKLPKSMDGMIIERNENAKKARIFVMWKQMSLLSIRMV